MATRQRTSSSKKKGRKAMQGRKAKKSMPKESMHEEYPSEMPEKAEMEG